MKIRLSLILAVGAVLFLHGCFVTRSGMRASGLGTWPPQSAQCARNANVAFNLMNVSIGGEMTRLFSDPACVSQPVCSGWIGQESRQLSGPVSGQFWLGPTNHQFTISEQDMIGSDARAAAIGQAPAGKRLYRLTFTQTPITGPPQGVVQATAHYGQCVTDIRQTTSSGGQRN